MTTKISTDNIQTASLEVLEGTGTTVYATIAELPLSDVEDGEQAYVIENNRLYLWTGTGWFNIALINTNPTITSGPNASYRFAVNGTPIVLTLIANDPEGFPITWSSQVTSGSLGNTAVITQSNNVFTITPSTTRANAGEFQVTFTASDGVNIATAASTFTLQFGPEDSFYNQSVLVTTSGTNNGNNNTFIDSSNNNFAITRNGNATQGTFSPFSPAGWSGYFDGTGDGLSIPTNTAFDFNGDFTIEAWINPSTVNFGVVTKITGSLAFIFRISSNRVMFVGGGANITGTTTIITQGRWHHVAVSRSGSTIRLFVDGVLDATTGTSSSTISNSDPVFIGQVAGSEFLNGFISNVRVVKGTALYTASFTPPTEPLTAVSGTSLLTLQDNRFIDRSLNNFTITRVGDTRVVPFSPLLPTRPYNTAVHGGSINIDGSSGSLTIANNNLVMPADFTVEAWIYPATPTPAPGWQNIIGPQYGGENVAMLIQAGTNLVAYVNASVLSMDGVVRPFQWNHIALTRQSGVLRLYHNGIRSANFALFNGLMSSNTYYVGVNGGGIERFTGQISSARVVKGTAIYTDNFTVPTEPPTAIANTNLLLNFTNSNIFDETGKVVLETIGNTRVSTSVVKYGNSSMFFDGTGDYMIIPTYEDVQSNNFTIEAWVHPTAWTVEWNTVFSTRLSATTATINLFGLGVHNSGYPYVYSDGFQVTGAAGQVALNTWTHLAVSRAGSTMRLFVNGAVVNTNVSSSQNYISTQAAIGANRDGSEQWTGFISDLRITNRHARYTANFTPPTAKLGYDNAE
jgi:hypothetical protein